MQNPALYRTIYVLSDIWQQVGWGSIIYLSALSGVDAQLYDAKPIDGAGRFQKLLHVTLPGIMPTIITMLILRIGSLMSIGYEKTILLYNPPPTTRRILSRPMFIASVCWNRAGATLRPSACSTVSST